MLEATKAFHAEHVEPALGRPVGSPEREIAELENRLGLRFPGLYRHYLAWMGRDINGIFRGSNWFVANIEGNKEILQGLLEEIESQYEVTASHIVFFTHQGYMAAWFDASLNEEDPQCWFINDGMREPEASGRFSEVLFNDIKGLASCL